MGIRRIDSFHIAAKYFRTRKWRKPVSQWLCSCVNRIHTMQPTNALMLKCISYTHFRNSVVFQYVLIIFRKLDGLLNTLTFMYKMFVDIKFMLVVQNWSIGFGGCSFIGFYSGSYKVDVSFVLAGYHNINLTVLSLKNVLGFVPPNKRQYLATQSHFCSLTSPACAQLSLQVVLCLLLRLCSILFEALNSYNSVDSISLRHLLFVKFLLTFCKLVFLNIQFLGC